MSFHYTSPPWTQHLLVGGVLGLSIAVGSTAAFAGGWASVVTQVPDRVLLTGGLMLLHTLVFWPVCFAFHRVDTTDSPAFIAKHRIQRAKRNHPELGPTIRVLLRNQFVLLPICLLIFGELLFLRGWTVQAELPTLGRLLLELAAQAVIAPIIFYVAHRALHQKWWMKRVHRIHHEFQTTTAFASEYAHPFEFVVGNVLTMVGGALIIAPHLLSMGLFALLGLLTILVHHSGYALPWAPYSVPHDWHHYRFNELYGSAGHIDRLLGTDKQFRKLKDGDVR